MDKKLFDALIRTLAAPRGCREAIKAGAVTRFAAGGIANHASTSKCRGASAFWRRPGERCLDRFGHRH